MTPSLYVLPYMFVYFFDKWCKFGVPYTAGCISSHSDSHLFIMLAKSLITFS